MKQILAVALCIGVLLVSCAEEQTADPVTQNPLLSEFKTPFGVPPFESIETGHYLPAFQEAIRQEKAEIQTIVESEAAPTFENSVEALDRSGTLLRQVSSVFFPMTSAMTSDSLEEVSKEVAPLLSAHEDDILLNADLFERIDSVWKQREELGLEGEALQLLQETYRDFVRGGALLSEEKKGELRSINERLSVLSVEFGQNVLKETNDFVLLIKDESDLAGLPESVVSSAAEAAGERGREGSWAFTLDKPSLIPFLQFSEKRNLREEIFKAYINRGDQNNESDNKGIVAEMASLRARKAALLGYESHAAYVLEENMAKTPEAVYELLGQLWEPSLEMARQEAEALEQMARREDPDFNLQPWDWWYYAEKIRKEQYDLDDEELRPYFQLEKVRDGAFEVANRLYGLQFVERSDLPVYHPDVRTFEVLEGDGSHIGILYVDYFPRAGKRAGAWMTSFRKQSRPDGERIAPIITNVANFSKPSGDRPALLSLEEVETLFHEFGHALHGLLSDCTYVGLSGTSVPRDFVELPSQIMENWATHPEVMKIYARHYETGEPIPDQLVDKIQAARKFNQGFATVEYLAAAYLDMDWHTLTEAEEIDVSAFEADSLTEIGLIPEIVVRYRSPYFSHIFAGGYSSGYYSYIWSEVLDADAFEAFRENGLFDRKTATAFRENILARGGSQNPAVLYRQFRGADPGIEALLIRKGLAADRM